MAKNEIKYLTAIKTEKRAVEGTRERMRVERGKPYKEEVLCRRNVRRSKLVLSRVLGN